MVWSALKIVIFVIAVAALTWGAGLLSESQGGLRIIAGETEYSLGPLQAAIAGLVLVVAIWVAVRLIGLVFAFMRFANGDETAISRYFDRRSQQKGFEALSEGLMAIASGEGRVAMAKAAKAERHLRRPELTNLIAAQAAEVSGDTRKAEEVYKRLLGDDRTRFVGVRGLMKQRLADGDTDTALRLAERAFALKPAHVETGDILLRLQAEDEDWAGARKTLAQKNRQGVLPRDVHRRRDAVLALSEARDVFRHGSTIEARETAIEANRLSPDLIPAAIMAAQSYITDGKRNYAERVLKKAWAAQPHPDIAATFATAVSDEDPSARLKRFKALIKLTPDHPEARMLEAELHIANRDFQAARVSLRDLAEAEPTARVLTIMAAIERGEGGTDDVVRAWLAQAVTANRGPQWVCENCQKVHSNWAAVCDNCESFDTIGWAVPKDGGRAMPEGSEMLPLLIAQTDTGPQGPEADIPEAAATVDAATEETGEGGQNAGDDTPNGSSDEEVIVQPKVD